MIKIRGYEITPEFFASRIDYAVVRQDMTRAELDDHIKVVKRLKTNSFYVNPHYLEYLAAELKGTSVLPAAVIDFPFGASTLAIKVAAMEDMVKKGAKSIDPVIDFAQVKNGQFDQLTKDCKELVAAAQGNVTKFIIECSLLTNEEIVQVTKCVEEAGGDYIKTGSGQLTGPEISNIVLIKNTLSKDSKTKIKFSGTGRFWTTPVALLGFAAGAEIIGTRAGDQVISEMGMMEDIFNNIEIIK